MTLVEVKANRAKVKKHKGSLPSLMINMRLPVAIAVPIYRVDIETGQIDENGIVVEFYTLGSARGKVWIEPAEKSLEAYIENELKLMESPARTLFGYTLFFVLSLLLGRLLFFSR